MNEALDLLRDCPRATDGDIAVMNLQSSRRRSWRRFAQDPGRSGLAELIVEQEQLAAQFLGDMDAFDRLEMLATQLSHTDVPLGRVALIRAQVAATTHRFADARSYLAQAAQHGASLEAVHRLGLSIDQACGTSLDAVLKERLQLAEQSGNLEDLVPLGALFADLREFAAADDVYRRALRVYCDVSPFAVASVCFRLGVLWGEEVPEPLEDKAVQWYRRAVAYVPGYVKARVHLSEIYCSWGRAGEAVALLLPVASCGDPEVCWRLADAMTALGKTADAEQQMHLARVGFETLLAQHLLAFADHGAEFYAGSGDDRRRAVELARVNLANRPTLRAFEQAHEVALSARDFDAASELLTAATERWGDCLYFRLSPLAAGNLELVKEQHHGHA